MDGDRRALGAPVWAVLACPECGGSLRATDGGAACAACGAVYPTPAGGPLRLRPREAQRVNVEVEVGGPQLADADLAAVARREPGVLGAAVTPPAALTVGNRLSARLTEFLPRDREGLLLDVGCGDRAAAPFLRRLTGLDYVGVDVEHEHAHVLADAHTLPFADGSMTVVTSFAMLEHVRHPWLVAREVRRVLRPGGRFVGTVAFLEPYHQASHSHLSPLGTLGVLQQAGLDVELLEPTRDWTGLCAVVSMTALPARLWPLARWLVGPLVALQRAAASVRRRAGQPGADPAWAAAGGFEFVARRPIEPS